MLDSFASPSCGTVESPAKLLLVDDEPYVLSVLHSLFSDSYHCQTASSAEEALAHLRRETYTLILSDIMMPGRSGLELLDQILQQVEDAVVIMVSGNLQIQSAIEALRRGAFDYVTKPFNLAEVELAVRRGLRHRQLLVSNRQYEKHLEELVSLRSHELRQRNHQLDSSLTKLYQNYRATLRGLAAALEARDVETRGHCNRVVAFCIRLGRQLGLSNEDMVALECGALLHDIGKIGVPDAILFKPGPLTEDEWLQMRRHVEYGGEILQDIEFLQDAAKVVQQHHEKYDGSGYLLGLSGEEIYVGARIFAVADAVDAFTSDRPYRTGRSFAEALNELRRCEGQHFDPKVVGAFAEVPLQEWQEIRRLVSRDNDVPTWKGLDQERVCSALMRS